VAQNRIQWQAFVKSPSFIQAEKFLNTERSKPKASKKTLHHGDFTPHSACHICLFKLQVFFFLSASLQA